MLVTTALLAQGINVQQVSFVINFDMPAQPQNYVHLLTCFRRFGRKGVVINFCSTGELKLLQDIERFYHNTIEELPQDFSDLV